MSDHRRLNNGDFYSFLDRIFAKGSGNEADFGLTPEIINQIKAIRDGLLVGMNDQAAKKAEAKASTSALNQKRKNGDNLVADIKLAMRAAKVPEDKFIEMGFDADDATPTPSLLLMPSDLSVKGFSNGVNALKYNRNGNKHGTIFIIEARTGDATEYSIVGTTTKTTFEHKNQKPGVKVVYRVRAQRGDEISDPSNEAVVYDE